jgi:hypothetical protein
MRRRSKNDRRSQVAATVKDMESPSGEESVPQPGNDF